MAAKEKENFRVELKLDVQPVSDRFTATVTFVATDDGKPFYNSSHTYPDLPAEAADLLEQLLEGAAGELPLSLASLSESKFVKLEEQLIGVMVKLNSFALTNIGKTSEEKRQTAKNLLKGKGKRS